MPELGSLLSVQEAGNDLIGDRSRPERSGSIFKTDTGDPSVENRKCLNQSNLGIRNPDSVPRGNFKG